MGATVICVSARPERPRPACSPGDRVRAFGQVTYAPADLTTYEALEGRDQERVSEAVASVNRNRGVLRAAVGTMKRRPLWILAAAFASLIVVSMLLRASAH